MKIVYTAELRNTRYTAYMPEIIEKLRPKIQQLARALIEECRKEGFEVRVVRGLRTHEEQEAFYARGRTEPGEIVTMVRGGYSFHNYGVAFDIRPIAKDAEDKKRLYEKAGPLGVRLGLEWGGAWKDFIDPPHFQLTEGYSIDDFHNDSVDWKKFD
jgi:peptidoglycan L-alanyl-D-glutamate endopeptidase CwlK